MNRAREKTCENEGRAMIGRLIKFLLFLVVLVAAGLAVYAYIGNLAPAPGTESLTVNLDVQN
jgi:hypothetical protein